MGEKIEHKFVDVNGLKLHVADIGSESSTAVVFLHGFPEVWYSWRHQMVGVAKAGFRAIAPDYRGYGLSDPPLEPDKTTYKDVLSDILALLDHFSITKAFLVGKDFGARIAYLFAFLHPEKVSGVVTLGIPYLPPSPIRFHELLPEGFYCSRWLEPGRAEADFGRLDSKAVVRNIYVLFSRPEIPIANEDQEIMDIVDSSTPLPPWFTGEDLEAYGSLYERSGFHSSTPLPPWFTGEDLEAYGSLYERSGFQTALKVPYRSWDEEFNITNTKFEGPALFIMGEKDYFIKFPGVEDYIRSDQAKAFVPKLETVYLPEGTHFVQEQLPDEVNRLIVNFLNKHK